MMENNKERIFYLDFLRAFAIICVLICHCDMFFDKLDTPLVVISQLVFHDIGRMGVPIFLMISGALLLGKEYNLSNFLKKRFVRIIYPFIFWVFLIVTGIVIINNDYKLAWDVIVGNFSVTWYFWTLIGIYLFIPIINSFLKDYGERGMEYFLIIWFVTIVLKTFNSYPLFTNFTLDCFAGYIGFPVLGYYLSTKTFDLDDKKMILISMSILLVSFSSYVFIHYAKLSIASLICLNVPIVFMSISLFLLVMYVDKITSFNHIKNNHIGSIIVSISLYSYGMYFSHVIVLKLLSFVNPHSNALVLVMLILLVFISWLLVYIVSKIPYLKKFSGI